MHSCDQGGGAWFRTTNPEEEHAFFDSETDEFHKYNGPVSQMKLISVANSNRGHYFTSFFDTSQNELKLGYSMPSDFWNQSGSGVVATRGRIDL